MCLSSIKVSSSSRVCPRIYIYDAILADRSTHSIKSWLEIFLNFKDQHNYTTHQVKKVEFDFSWAFLHASVEAFNKTDLTTYLQMLFEVATKAKEMSAFSFFTVNTSLFISLHKSCL